MAANESAISVTSGQASHPGIIIMNRFVCCRLTTHRHFCCLAFTLRAHPQHYFGAGIPANGRWNLTQSTRVQAGLQSLQSSWEEGVGDSRETTPKIWLHDALFGTKKE